jgi:hypothetical protein
MKKTMRIAINGRPVTVSTERVKPAFIMAQTDSRTATSRAPQSRQHKLHHSRAHRTQQSLRPPFPVAASVSRRSSTCEKHSPRVGCCGNTPQYHIQPFSGPPTQ